MNPPADPAQASQTIPPGDSGSPDPSSSGPGGAPAGSQPSPSDLEARLRERGRNEAELQRQIQALSEQNRALSGQLGGIVTKISADEERAWNAQLAQMEPADRAAAIATRALEENQALRRQIQQGRAPQQPAVDPVAYKERKSREMVEAANERHGLTGDAAMTVDDFDEEDLVDEKTFNTALRVEARLRAQGGAVPKKKKESADDVVNRRVQEELRKHGVASPASAKPASSSGSSAVSEEDVQHTLRNTRGSPRDKVAALRALEIKVDRPGRR